MVRADSRSQTLHSFSAPKLSSYPSQMPTLEDASSSHLKEKRINSFFNESQPPIENFKRSKIDVRLKSILSLRETIQKETHSGRRHRFMRFFNLNRVHYLGLYEIFHEHIFVGCINEELTLIQCHIKLYLVNCVELR